MAKFTRIGPNQPVRHKLIPDDGADLIRTVGEANQAGAEWNCSRCGNDIEVGHMYRIEIRMKRHITCKNRR